jgi:hypothetical protein
MALGSFGRDRCGDGGTQDKVGWYWSVIELKIELEKNEAASGMCDLARKFAVFAVISALLTQGSYAQGLPDMQEFPASSRQKAAEELKKAQEKAADEVYEAMVKRVKPTKTPDKKFDPWGGLRTPSANQ